MSRHCGLEVRVRGERPRNNYAGEEAERPHLDAADGNSEQQKRTEGNRSILDFERKMALSFLVLVSILLSILLIWKYGNIHYILHSVNQSEDTLVQIHDDFLSTHQCQQFSDHLKDHRFVSKNPLNEQFEGSYGVVLCFKRSPRMWTHLTDCDLKMMIPTLEKCMQGEANAFVLNVLMIDPEKEQQRPTGKSVEYHYDMTLNQMCNGKIILPRWVFAIYLSLPEPFVGGSLMLRRFNGAGFLKPDAVVQPRIGRMIRFRGDSLHSVEKLYSESSEQRISLILEQYCLPDSNYEELSEFRFSSPPDRFPNYRVRVKHKVVESLYFLRFYMASLAAFGN